MGTYLTTEFISSFSVSKSEVTNLADTEQEALTLIQKAFVGCEGDFFEITTNDYSFNFRIKTAIFETQFIPFLTEFYHDFYGENEECNEVLTLFKQNPTIDTWFKLLEREYPLECFYEGDGGYSSIYINRQKVHIGFGTIILAREGKVIAEEFDQHASFFEKIIAKAYPKYIMAKLITVCITG